MASVGVLNGLMMPAADALTSTSLSVEHAEGDLVVDDVKKGVALEGTSWPLEAHQQLGEQRGGDVDGSQGDRLPQRGLDLGRCDVQVGGRQPKGVGGNGEVAVAVEQSFPPGRAVHVVGQVDVTDPLTRFQKLLDGQDDRVGRGDPCAERIGHAADGVACQYGIGRGRFLRGDLVGLEKDRQDHPAGSRDGRRQGLIVVQPARCFLHGRKEGLFRFAGAGKDRLGEQRLQILERGQTRALLGLAENEVEANGFRLAGADFFNAPGDEGPGPWPAPELLDGIVVDVHHHHGAGAFRITAHPHHHVVDGEFQRADKTRLQEI